MRHLWYDRLGWPISVQRAERLLGDPEYVRVAEHTEAGFWISTVWLACDHSIGFPVSGPPILFETMIFGPEDWQGEYVERYPTEAAALAGHDQAVAWLRDEIRALHE